MKPKEYLKLLEVFEKLKDTTRHSWTSRGRIESVAEHSWRTAVMAFLMQDEFGGQKIDTNKVMAMCLFHDLGEAVTGDIPAWKKTAKDCEIESRELHKLLNTFPQSVKAKLKPLLMEFEEQITPESKLAKALDKFETIIQHNEANISTWTNAECIDHTTNFHYLDNYMITPELEQLKNELHTQMIQKVKNK